jgi:hypothetical protein
MITGTILGYYQASYVKKMVVVSKKPLKPQTVQQEQHWDNPANPEKASDARDAEQLKRQKKDVEQKNSNLTDKPINKP